MARQRCFAALLRSLVVFEDASLSLSQETVLQRSEIESGATIDVAYFYPSGTPLRGARLTGRWRATARSWRSWPTNSPR